MPSAVGTRYFPNQQMLRLSNSRSADKGRKTSFTCEQLKLAPAPRASSTAALSTGSPHTSWRAARGADLDAVEIDGRAPVDGTVHVPAVVVEPRYGTSTPPVELL